MHPVILERNILDAHGRRVPRNRIWAVLKEAGLEVNTPAKQRSM